MIETVLGPTERVPGRPFTSVDLYESDLAVLMGMIDQVRTYLDRAHAGQINITPYKRIARTKDGLKRRDIFCSPEELESLDELAVVGFLAERNEHRDMSRLEKANAKIVTEFKHHPGILSYSSRELPSSNWANLVLNRSREVADQWSESESHTKAADELSPLHYRSVRIHSGRLPGGLRGGGRFIIERTRYLDYRSQDVWRAVREPAPTPPSR